MKSEIAKHCIEDSMTIHNGAYIIYVSLANLAIDLAEMEAEVRIKEKAVNAFKASCLYQEGCLGAGMKCNPDKCEDLKAFIQKLNDEE